MEIQEITSSAIKRLTKIGDRKYHSRFGEYLIEGVRLVEEAFRAEVEIRELAVVPGAERRDRIKVLIESALVKQLPVWRVKTREMERISRTENNQGIVAGIAGPAKSPGEIYGELLQTKGGLVIFLDGLQDPGNVGTLIRTSEAFGVEGVILGSGSAGLFNPKTLRSTMGAVFRVSVAEMHEKSAVEIIDRFAANDFQVVAASIGEECVRLDNAVFSDKVLLIIGREATGISETLIDRTDLCVRIPTTGPTESLNAAVAGSIIIYRIVNNPGR